jgi:precorrin-6A synthase
VVHLRHVLIGGSPATPRPPSLTAAGAPPCGRLARVRQLLVIGIGAGDPDYLTLQAVKAIGRADVFFLLDKGEAKDSLIDLRRQILAEHARPGHRVAHGRDPRRDRAPTDYPATIASWRSDRAAVCAGLIAGLADGETGAFLVWGDPSLYDSTIAILDELLTAGVDFDYEVIPGISSVSALAAKHRIGLNRVGQPVQITTGRRLAEDGLPDGVGDVVVMLDAHSTFARVPPDGVDIYWGAYIGTSDELLAAGPLASVAETIAADRAQARADHGWIMDTYLLRRH